MTLVRNQTRDMLSGETGKITFGRNKNKIRASSSKNYIFCKNIGTVHWEGADLKAVVVKFMTVFVTRRVSPIPS